MLLQWSGERHPSDDHEETAGRTEYYTRTPDKIDESYETPGNGISANDVLVSNVHLFAHNDPNLRYRCLTDDEDDDTENRTVHGRYSPTRESCHVARARSSYRRFRGRYRPSRPCRTERTGGPRRFGGSPNSLTTLRRTDSSADTSSGNRVLESALDSCSA